MCFHTSNFDPFYVHEVLDAAVFCKTRPKNKKTVDESKDLFYVHIVLGVAVFYKKLPKNKKEQQIVHIF